MIQQSINILNWNVTIFYAVTKYNVRIIHEALKEIGCRSDYLRKAVRNITTETRNNGVTYANMQNRRAVVVIGYCDVPKQYLNTIVHEIMHLTTYIATREHINYDSEDFCYLAGDLASMMYRVARNIICPCCLKKYRYE